MAYLIERLGLTDLIDRFLPRPGSNRGYGAGMLFCTLMLLSHDGSRCLEDVGDLDKERLLLVLLGVGRLPTAKTPGNWLRCIGADADPRLSSADLSGPRSVVVNIHREPVPSRRKDTARADNCEQTRKWRKSVGVECETEFALPVVQLSSGNFGRMRNDDLESRSTPIIELSIFEFEFTA